MIFAHFHRRKLVAVHRYQAKKLSILFTALPQFVILQPEGSCLNLEPLNLLLHVLEPDLLLILGELRKVHAT